MIKSGSNVSMHYTLKVDGEILDQSTPDQPLEYTHGSGQLIPGLEEELEGMGPSDTKTVHVAAEKGYGLRDEAAVQKVPRNAFPEDSDIEIGTEVTGEAEGHPIHATITAHDAESVTLDMNHPLAGKDLHFEIEIVSVA